MRRDRPDAEEGDASAEPLGINAAPISLNLENYLAPSLRKGAARLNRDFTRNKSGRSLLDLTDSVSISVLDTEMGSFRNLYLFDFTSQGLQESDHVIDLFV